MNRIQPATTIPNRRHFLKQSASCCAHLAMLGGVSSLAARKVFAADDEKKIVAKGKWGRIEQLCDFAWSLISTPLEQDFKTVCNGGIIAGKDRVVVIESFMQPAGAKLVAEWAKKLTGRWPTDVVLTHYHGDHCSGTAGFVSEQETPKLWATKTTHTTAVAKNRDGVKELEQLEVAWITEERPVELDLGGRKLTIQPKAGHTKSDVVVELADPKTIWCGDLVWNRMFPNYMDATPSQLAATVGELLADNDTAYVPGHGPMADRKAVEVYLEMLNHVERAARDAVKKGLTPSEAAKSYQLPQPVENWTLFSPKFFQDAFTAWQKELTSQQ